MLVLPAAWLLKYSGLQEERGIKDERRKGSVLVFSSSAFSFLSSAALELKEQKTLLVFPESTLILPCDFLSPQLPLVLWQESRRSMLHHLREPAVPWEWQHSVLQLPSGFYSTLLHLSGFFSGLLCFSVALSHSSHSPYSSFPKGTHPGTTASFFLFSQRSFSSSLSSIHRSREVCFIVCFFPQISFSSSLTRTSPCLTYCFSINSPSKFK